MNFARKQKKIRIFMNYKLSKISVITVLFSILFLCGCEVGYRDYKYIVRHSAESRDSIFLTYSLNGETELLTKRMGRGDTFVIYERKDVTGNDVWDIETSSSMFAVPSITATVNGDAIRMTEELSLRTYWAMQPPEQGSGVYELRITDALFVLENQQHFYGIYNSTDDTLFVISELFNKDRERDTIPPLNEQGSVDIGSVDIFVYDEEHCEADKKRCDEKKLSGIMSLSITYKEIRKNIDLKKPYLYDWDTTEREKSTLNVKESIFDE